MSGGGEVKWPASNHLRRQGERGRNRDPQRTCAHADQKQRAGGAPAQLDDQLPLLVVVKLLVLVVEMGAGCVWARSYLWEGGSAQGNRAPLTNAAPSSQPDPCL